MSARKRKAPKWKPTASTARYRGFALEVAPDRSGRQYCWEVVFPYDTGLYGWKRTIGAAQRAAVAAVDRALKVKP